MEPLRNPKKSDLEPYPEDSTVGRIYSRLKRVINDREQFINTVRYQEDEFKELRKEIKAMLTDRWAWWKGFAYGVIWTSAMAGVLVVITIIFR